MFSLISYFSEGLCHLVFLARVEENATVPLSSPTLNVTVSKIVLFRFVETESYCVAQTVLELLVLWDWWPKDSRVHVFQHTLN